MANLTALEQAPVGDWQGTATLVKDEDTGQHYVVSTINRPWDDKLETLVYKTDDQGTPPSSVELLTTDPDAANAALDEAFVAGDTGMDHEAAFADLNARIDEGSLYTVEDAREWLRKTSEESLTDLIAWALEGIVADEPEVA